MASRKRHPRSSIKICQENFSCKDTNSEATVECRDCKTFQCEYCDVSLHTTERHRYHDRVKIKKVDTTELCQEGQSSQCTKKNFADLWCDECQTSFCFTCDSTRHKSKRKLHNRHPFDVKKQNEPIDNVVDNIAMLSIDGKVQGHYSKENISIEDDSFHSLSYMQIPTGPNDCQANYTITSSYHSNGSKTSLPDIIDAMVDLDVNRHKDVCGFLLVDTNELLQVNSCEEFVYKLGCPADAQVKVISIFGNTGDGKSHTLNYTFFGGKEVFKTSSTQQSCTVGVWTAYDPQHNTVVIDTEGLLGISANSNRRTRLLLKILAISDIIIYRTKAERLHDDLFQFLGDASKAYQDHFVRELKSVSEKRGLPKLSSLGPSVIVFHETIHTNPLKSDGSKCPEDSLRQTFAELEISFDAFSSLHYVGTKTKHPPTDFNHLLDIVIKQLKDTTVRSNRKPLVIFKALQVLNEKFSGDIERCLPASFPDQYFTCASKCLSCGARCRKTMNHNQDNVKDDHDSERDVRCKYQHQFENKVYLCKACNDEGRNVVVVPKATSSKDNAWFGLANYAWSGYVLECYKCGIVYRSRQYWYGNDDPDKSAVRTEIRHVWPGTNPVLMGTHNAAQRFVDGITFMSGAIASVSSKPAKVVGHWVTDQIAPNYWVPNARITNCRKCKTIFSEAITIHHCRACGHGFCDDCSSNKRPVPERGWGMEPVRVCDKCYNDQLTDSSNSESGENLVTLRKGAEVVGSTVATVVSYPLEAIKDSSRPTYWRPDHEILKCYVCAEEFGPKLRIHHCRACGEGVCGNCSPHQRPVEARGWDHPVRVCKKCVNKL